MSTQVISARIKYKLPLKEDTSVYMVVKSKEPARNAKDKQAPGAPISLPPGLNGSIIMKLQEMGKWQEVKADLLKNPKSSAWERMLPSPIEPAIAEDDGEAPESKTIKPRAKPANAEKPKIKPREMKTAQTKKEAAPPSDPFKDWLSIQPQESFLDLHDIKKLHMNGELPPSLSEKYRHLLIK